MILLCFLSYFFHKFSEEVVKVMNIGVEERRLAIEIIATLVNIKKVMAELILQPAGVPPKIYQQLISLRDKNTGQLLSKRQIAPLIFDAMEKEDINSVNIICKIIKIAANWDKFHLAYDEYKARATVQKAREVFRNIKLEEGHEEKQREQERLEQIKHEQANLIKNSERLSMMFDELTKSQDPHGRGRLLEDLLNQLFILHGIPAFKQFRRNKGAEQIDGAFKLEGWYYLVECRWRKKLADIRELDGLKGQVERSGKQTMGFFISVNGWSNNVPRVLKQNPQKIIILMDGYDLRSVLSETIDLRDFILAKIAKFNIESEPFYGVKNYLKDKDI